MTLGELRLAEMRSAEETYDGVRKLASSLGVTTLEVIPGLFYPVTQASFVNNLVFDMWIALRQAQYDLVWC